MVEVVDDGLKVLHEIEIYSPAPFSPVVYCDVFMAKFRPFARM